MTNQPLKICYWPGRESSYSRNRVLLRAMRSTGIEVYDCSAPQKNFLRYPISFFRFLKNKNKADVIFIGFLGHFLMPVARLCTRKKVIFDIFVSIYQTMASDRKTIPEKGVLAGFAKYIDRLSCQMADYILCDTNQHIEYFIREYRLPREKFSRLFVGSDDSVMYPRPSQEQKEFIVHFHGEFQALHGVEYIIEAAALLPDVQFQIIGQGKTQPACLKMAKDLDLKNINFISSVPYEKLPEYMAKVSVCLGIFGNTPKAQMVIPHKAFEALAMAKPLITADTLAARELLTDKQNVYFCKPADAQNLAETIKILHNDLQLRRRIAEGGHQLFQKLCAPKVLGEQIKRTAQ